MIHTYLYRFTLVVIFIFSTSLLFAQEALPNLSLKLQALDEAKDYHSILAFEEEILAHQEALTDQLLDDYSSCLYFIAKSYVHTAKDLVKAKQYFEELEKMIGGNKNPRLEAKCLFYYGVIYFYLQNYEEALVNYQAAIAMQKRASIEDLAVSYNALAGLYKSLQHYPQAIENYARSLELNRKLKPKEAAIAYNNLATVYLQMGHFTQAESYIDSAFMTTNDATFLDDIHTNLGRIYETRGATLNDPSYYHKALTEHRKALEIRKKIGNKRDLLNSYLNLGANYQNLENYAQAQRAYEQALEFANEAEGVDDLRSILYLNLSDIYYVLSEEDQSLDYLKNYVALYDSSRLQEAMMTRIMHFERLEHKKTMAEKDRELAEQQQVLANTRLIWMSIASLLLILALLMSVRHYYRKERDKRIIIEKNEETIWQQEVILEQEKKLAQQARIKLVETHTKDLLSERIKVQEVTLRKIARDLHDHIGNRITALLWGLPEGSSKPYQNIKRQLTELYDQIENISQFLKPVGLQNGLLPSLGELCADAQKENLTVELYTYQMRWRRFASEVELNVYRIVQEALTNIIKYAEANAVTIQLIYNDKGKESLNLTIEDDGKGFEMNQQALGIGLSNMRDRAEELNGTFSIDSIVDQGTVIFVEIPAELKGIRKA